MVDIDGTICSQKHPKPDYPTAEPNLERIEKLNKLYDEGHEIHYWTARGSGSGKDWRAFTKEQLIGWGVKATSINCGKPMYDIWVDDKAINDNHFFNVNNDSTENSKMEKLSSNG
jgi:hypothetical protein